METGKVVKLWNSGREASSKGFGAGSICNCCKGKAKSHKWYYWEYE
jgi:hypothetical protein